MNKYLFFASIIFLFACKSSQKISGVGVSNTILANEVIHKFQQSQHQYHNASLKAKVEFTDKKTQSFTANIRMVRDSIIWASLTGTLGVEGARVIVTKDSIHILDKLNKVYYKKPFNFIYQYVPFSLSMNFLQDILIGNNSIDTTIKTDFMVDKTYVLKQETEKLVTSYAITPDNFVALIVKMQETLDNRQVAMKYEDYRPANDTDSASKLFSFQRYVDFKSGKKINIDIKFSKVSWNEELSFPFNVGEKYEVQY